MIGTVRHGWVEEDSWTYHRNFGPVRATLYRWYNDELGGVVEWVCILSVGKDRKTWQCGELGVGEHEVDRGRKAACTAAAKWVRDTIKGWARR